MKNHRFLWLRNRTTDNRKCEKARNIKEKRTIEMFNTVSKQLVAHRSSLSANQIFVLSKCRKRKFSALFLCFRTKQYICRIVMQNMRNMCFSHQ